MDIRKAKAQIKTAKYNCEEGWPFPDAEIVLNGYEKAINYMEQIQTKNKRLIEALEKIIMETRIMETRIICNVKSCEHCGKSGICDCACIHLQPCSTEADNVVGCSEFLDKEQAPK